MKRNAIRSLVVMMIAVMVFAFTPVPVSAATKAPAKVKISSVKVSNVSKYSNTCTMLIKWKKAKKATGYVVYMKYGSGQWEKKKKLGRLYRGLRVYNTPCGQIQVKVQAINKKKKGKFSKVKTKFVPSKLTLAEYADRIEPAMKTGPSGETRSFAGNTMTFTYDLSGKIDNIDETKAKINALVPTMKSDAHNIITKAKLDCGISGVKVVYNFVYNGTSLGSWSFTY